MGSSHFAKSVVEERSAAATIDRIPRIGGRFWRGQHKVSSQAECKEQEKRGARAEEKLRKKGGGGVWPRQAATFPSKMM